MSPASRVVTRPRPRRPEPEERLVLPSGILPAIVAVALVIWMARHDEGDAIPTPGGIAATLDTLEAAGVTTLGHARDASGAGRTGGEAVSAALEALQARGWLTRLSWPIRIAPYGSEQLPGYLRRLADHASMGPTVRRAAGWLRAHPAGRPPTSAAVS